MMLKSLSLDAISNGGLKVSLFKNKNQNSVGTEECILGLSSENEI